MSESEKQIFLASGELLSISQAAKYTPYTSEYLSLLARKSRLPAVKLGRDWVTTKSAVLKYVKEQEFKHCKFIVSFENARKGVI